MSKKLVAYFSASGTTKKAAERLAKAAGADLFEIKPVTPYTDADLNWMDPNSRSSREMNNLDSHPEIAEFPQNMDDYDTVFLGFPIWWYVAPHIVHTFLRNCDLSGKTLACFATSGGNGMGKTAEILERVRPDAIWKPGKMLNYLSDRELADWAKQF